MQRIFRHTSKPPVDPIDIYVIIGVFVGTVEGMKYWLRGPTCSDSVMSGVCHTPASILVGSAKGVFWPFTLAYGVNSGLRKLSE